MVEKVDQNVLAAMYDTFSGLGERGLMTPTYLSRLIMRVLLPATLRFVVEKNKPLENNAQGFCTAESWHNRANIDDECDFISFRKKYYEPMAQTHTFTSLFVDGIETLEAKQTSILTQQYEIFCCGNAQDAMHFYSAYSRIKDQPNKNYIFWNYPGVGNSVSGAHSANDLFKVAYQQAMRLLEQGILAKDITLRGLSLGGGVATHVARQLHENGHLVNLEVDRSFARVAAVVPPLMKKNMLNHDVYVMTVANLADIPINKLRKDRATLIKVEHDNKYVIYGNTDGTTWSLTDFNYKLPFIQFPQKNTKPLIVQYNEKGFKKGFYDAIASSGAHTSTQSHYTPLISSIIALAVSGAALGTTFAGFIASVGLATASSMAAIGYIGTYFIRAIGFLLHKIMNIIGTIIAFPFGLFSTAMSDDIKAVFDKVGYYLAYPFNLSSEVVDKIISIVASLADSAIYLSGNIAGAAVAISGLIVGGLAGLVFGMLLSVQLLWTNEPLLMPMAFAFSAVLSSSCCEMDSVNEIEQLVYVDNKAEHNGAAQPKISVTNTVDDEVIDVTASLNVGLGFHPGKKFSGDNKMLKEKITSFWYCAGGHGGQPEELIPSGEEDIEADAHLGHVA